MALRNTRNDLGENTKKVSVTVLNGTLTDMIDLTNSVRMAHWTMRGPNFIGLHGMLETFYNELFATADEVAERLVQIGGTPDGTSQIVAEKSRLPAYSQATVYTLDHVKELADRFASLARSVREGIDSTDEAGDADTADLLTGLSRDLDKKLWMLEAHLEEK
ncbi:DNA starvation/stationary phase protection protein Dps [Pseudoroseomonas rhizosphaerae]|uniref:DNA starvation/stationary phase protection protein Dps n=1 Tax=Teichococcus rhizosphaerae TaxID=1335062 RepID=A0A2C7AAX2_9PROT|nr:DNA starvation/stationary phase protection protein Dps [Pseudoroseomonas rhizosphaerae]PHK94555.1 DNA starvation/stationary phase protection protein Dps [Pseudoroseomonas rhizosphaerae]